VRPEERLIVALDFDTLEKALGVVEALKPDVKRFKIGLELFSSSGPDIVRKVGDKGVEVFLDLKFHDIPNTVAKAARAATRLKPAMFNVHALGGYDMMKAAAEAAADEAKKLLIKPPKVLAVTVLTSIDGNALKKIGIDDNMEKTVLRLAVMAKDAGLDGVVASSWEIKPLRQKLGKDFLIATPGVRPKWASAGGQKRTATPKEAIEAGADYIVVGRPITEAKDAAEAARKIIEEIS
jgi:orotidine-5'-phosphate decarboxylase